MSASGGLVGVGLDTVEIDRFRAVLARTPAVTGRLFTAEERAIVGGRRDSVPGLAARFAAKEAVLKSLSAGIGACGWHDIEVGRRPGGEPTVVLTGAAAILASERGVSRWHLSLTHTGSSASAIAIAES